MLKDIHHTWNRVSKPQAVRTNARELIKIENTLGDEIAVSKPQAVRTNARVRIDDVDLDGEHDLFQNRKR